MEAINPIYFAYASAHQRSVNEQFAVDAEEYPGGKMAGFIVWVSRMTRQFKSKHPECFRGDSIADEAAWLRFVSAPQEPQFLLNL